MRRMPVTPLELHAGDLRLALRADLGGAIAGLWRGATPVLRSTEPADLTAVRGSGCFPLVPYSNRLGHRRFQWQGQDHTTAANFPDSPHTLHGVAWLRPWEVLSAGASAAELAYRHTPDADWPFAFDVRQRFELEPGRLTLRLALTNRAAQPQPVGLGWHPYFPTSMLTAKSAPARGCASTWPNAGTAMPASCPAAAWHRSASTARWPPWPMTIALAAGRARRRSATRKALSTAAATS